MKSYLKGGKRELMQAFSSSTGEADVEDLAEF